MQLYWRKINQLLAELLVDHSSIDNLHHLFSAILNSVLEDRLTNSSKPPNNLSENFKKVVDQSKRRKGDKQKQKNKWIHIDRKMMIDRQYDDGK